jgi:hypothetical protein
MEEVVRCESIHGNMRGEEIRMDMSTERPWAQVSLSDTRDDSRDVYPINPADPYPSNLDYGASSPYGGLTESLRDDWSDDDRPTSDGADGEDRDYQAEMVARKKDKWKKSREQKSDGTAEASQKPDLEGALGQLPGSGGDDDVDEQTAMVERKRNAWLKSRGGR